MPVRELATMAAAEGGTLREYARPEPIREIAERMRKWAFAQEVCQSCSSMPAVSIRSGQPLCGRCRENRGLVLNFDTAGLKPREVREDGEAGALMRGTAIVFNSRSVDLGGFVEIIRPSAADRLEAEKPDLRALWNHDTAITIGRSSAGTLRYRKASRGVVVEIDPPKWAHGYVESVERRDINGMSFAFSVITDDWRMEDGMPLREVLDMDVYEVSGVSFPAYPATTLSVARNASRSEWYREQETAERLRMAR